MVTWKIDSISSPYALGHALVHALARACPHTMTSDMPSFMPSRGHALSLCPRTCPRSCPRLHPRVGRGQSACVTQVASCKFQHIKKCRQNEQQYKCWRKWMTTYSLNGCGKQVRFVHEGAKEKLELNLSNTSMNSILITKFPQSKKLKKKKKNLKINFLIISVENHLIVFDIKNALTCPKMSQLSYYSYI